MILSKKIVSRLKLSRDELIKYTSNVEDSANELKNCKKIVKKYYGM
ncbi:MAG: hypothetical protein L6V91_00800 [Bacilli bacterium]|nr:MAG: hypothetical protein L6V91_00800 [Bacilli bacterium]